MENFDPIKSINENIIACRDIRIVSKCVKNIINYCTHLIVMIHKNNTAPSVQFIKEMLIEHVYITYYCTKSLSIILLTNQNKELEKIDNEFNAYIESFFNNPDIYKLFKAARTNVKDDHEIYFFDNMISRCEKQQKFTESQNDITRYTNEIYAILERDEHVPIDAFPENIKQYILTKFADTPVINRTTRPVTILLNSKLYYHLQTTLVSQNDRKIVEQLYLAKSDKCLGLLERIITRRLDHANSLKYESYFQYRKKDINAAKIQEIMYDFVLKIDPRAKKEIIRIHNQMTSDITATTAATTTTTATDQPKISVPDIIYYNNKLMTNYTFKLKNVVDVAFDIIKQYFSITFTEIPYEKLWNPYIKTYKAHNKENTHIGYIHLDLLNNNNEKNMSSPICIHMHHKYKDLNANTHTTRIAIIGNYYNYTDPVLYHNDVISIFKEFGTAIQFLLFDTTTGNMNYRDEYYLLTSKIMEYSFWERSTLDKLCDDINTGEQKDAIINNIIFTRYIDFANAIKQRCIYAYFDYMIHGNTEIITHIKNLNTYDGMEIKAIYAVIHNNIMNSHKEYYDMDSNKIHPLVIMQEINGAETSIYETISIEILSFSLFNLIKKGYGSKYLKIISNADSKEFNASLTKFVGKIKDNNYDYYLQNVIAEKEIDTEMNMKIIKEQPRVINKKKRNAVMGDTNVKVADTVPNADKKQSDDNSSQGKVKIFKKNKPEPAPKLLDTESDFEINRKYDPTR